MNKTRLGALIRAGVDDPEMVEAMGINIRRVLPRNFYAWCGACRTWWRRRRRLLTLYPSADAEILVFSLAVVIIGGVAAFGALL